jgi:formylglycine-generating enzyme required for sulfatase activity
MEYPSQEGAQMQKRRQRGKNRSRSRQLRMEPLEDRRLLAVTIETVLVGDADNSDDVHVDGYGGGPYGGVDHNYRIGKTEVTNAQYIVFLNAVADADPNGLFNSSMESDLGGGIVRMGSPGNYEYSVRSNAPGKGLAGTDYTYANKPVTFVSWYDAIRFANWLHNGQPAGPQIDTTTEDGAYNLDGPTTVGPRNPSAKWFLPSEDEWYKAAFYDGATDTYYDYATRSNTAPSSTPSTSNIQNSANYRAGTAQTPLAFVMPFAPDYPHTDAAAYTMSASPYGTFDQGGNVWEWSEEFFGSTQVGLRGASFNDFSENLLAENALRHDPIGGGESLTIGFRVATVASGEIRGTKFNDLDGDGIWGRRSLLVTSDLNPSPVREYDAADGSFVGDFTADLASTKGITFGTDGSVYVAVQATHQVLRYSSSGAFLDIFADSNDGLFEPHDIAFGPDGKLYVANFAGGNVTRHDGQSSEVVAVLSAPYGLGFGPDGRLFVGSAAQDSISMYDVITPDLADRLLGSFTGGGLNDPLDIIFDAAGSLYVSSYQSDQVLKFVSSGQSFNFASVFVTQNDGGLDGPTGLAWGPNGDLYVASRLSFDLLRYDGQTGAFIDVFQSGPDLAHQQYLAFSPDAEPTLSGWTIYLDDNNNGVLDPGEPSTVTDANGNYEFDNLQPGTYTVHEVQQPGWEQTFPAGSATVEQQAKLNALDAGPPTNPNSFGYATGLSGEYAIVSAPSQNNTTGASYVFVRNGTTWTQQAKLLAADGISHDAFGQSVAISGNTALVGAVSDDNAAGSAYVYVRNGAEWTQQEKLIASDRASGDTFGQYVSIDGDYALIGSLQDNNDNGSESGSAYVFARNGATWSQQAKLLPSDGGALKHFGYSVSINGTSALIGATGNAGQPTGTAYVFTRSGEIWTEQAKLIPLGGGGFDFGISVSIEGDYALVGARDEPGGTGAVYVFHREGTIWTQQAKLTASDAASLHLFGDSVSLSGDLALIGARGNDSVANDAGAAYLFRRVGTNWVEVEKITASDGTASDFFGVSVALDGNAAIVGAYTDAEFGVDSGSAYAFQIGGVGSHIVTVDAGETVNDTDFGNREVPTGLPGDFDHDGDVDGRDFLLWQRGGSPSPLSPGDLSDWQGNYGVGQPLVATLADITPTDTALSIDANEVDTRFPQSVFLGLRELPNDSSDSETVMSDSYVEQVDRALEEFGTMPRYGVRGFGEMVARRTMGRRFAVGTLES